MEHRGRVFLVNDEMVVIVITMTTISLACSGSVPAISGPCTCLGSPGSWGTGAFVVA
jgi:hypothetical protein